jgi:hypothetical protein
MGCVGVYSNVEPYKNIIGLHASNWFDELTFLINNEGYRKQLYNHALEYVLKNRLIENNIDVYSRIFADIYEIKKIIYFVLDVWTKLLFRYNPNNLLIRFINHVMDIIILLGARL